jgi:3-oxoacyl-[acyl-carrier protein] reductase
MAERSRADGVTSSPTHIVLTGASRGLGAGLCDRLTGDGHRVTALVRRRGALPGRVDTVEADLAQSDQLASAIDAAEEFAPIDVLINCAALGDGGLFVLQEESVIAEMIEINLLSPMLLMRQAAKHMMRRRAGRIINISSIAGHNALSGLTAYGATKAGLNQLTVAFAAEMAPRCIVANAIAPGYMDTDMTASLSDGQRATVLRRTPSGRPTTLSDVAAVVEFLLVAPLNLTGQILTIDGGSTL